MGGVVSVTEQKKQAFEHYLKLYEMSLSDHVSEVGRAWLKNELAEMDRDMKAAGLIKH